MASFDLEIGGAREKKIEVNEGLIPILQLFSPFGRQIEKSFGHRYSVVETAIQKDALGFGRTAHFHCEWAIKLISAHSMQIMWLTP